MPAHPTPAEPLLTVREMLPDRRFAPPRWEVKLGAQVIGWVELHEHRSVRLYLATGVHRATGEYVRLENSTDLQERAGVIHRFWLDPLQFGQHLPWNLRQYHRLDF